MLSVCTIIAGLTDDPLAQLVEHNTFNVGVLGSSPKRITKASHYEMLFSFYKGLSPKGSFAATL